MPNSSHKIVAGRRWMGSFARLLLCTGLAWSTASVLMSNTAQGFAEEPNTSPNQSTIHYAMTRALAVCAGYGSDADIVATYAQLTDRADQTTGVPRAPRSPSPTVACPAPATPPGGTAM